MTKQIWDLGHSKIFSLKIKNCLTKLYLDAQVKPSSKWIKPDSFLKVGGLVDLQNIEKDSFVEIFILIKLNKTEQTLTNVAI